MKKLISMILALALGAAMLTGCGSTAAAPTTEATTQAAVTFDGTMEQLLNKIVELCPVEFYGDAQTLDLTDTSEEGLWALQSNTGLENADEITDAAVFEPMMGSIAYSMVAVRVGREVGIQTVAEAMKENINPRKWICVEANDVLTAGSGDVVLFIMLDTQLGMNAQDFVDAFAQVMGAEPDFVI